MGDGVMRDEGAGWHLAQINIGALRADGGVAQLTIAGPVEEKEVRQQGFRLPPTGPQLQRR